MTTTAEPAEATRTLSDSDFLTPPAERYFEDYLPGSVYEYGQPIHIDPEFAAQGAFGGLIASGLHTTGICMRLFVTHYLSHVASLASPGMDELRWPTPVRPGDLLRLRTTIVSVRPSQSKPDRGLVHTRAELFNQHDEIVLHLLPINILRRRDVGDG
jgi:acyl dehydratase